MSAFRVFSLRAFRLKALGFRPWGFGLKLLELMAFFLELGIKASGLRENELHFLNAMGFFGRAGFFLSLNLKPLA